MNISHENREGRGEDRLLMNRTVQIAHDVWSIITYEESWKSYINNYCLKKQDSYLLIDTNLRKHRAYFQESLHHLGATTETIDQVFCTHRHPDHIGNVEIFPSRNNWIHLDDYYDLDDFSQTLFGHTITGFKGEVSSLQYQLLPSHTSGSLAFFDPVTCVAFAGDHLSFFGDPIGQVIGYEEERRESFLRYVVKWKEQEWAKVKQFAEGIEALLSWPIEVLATGHGPILRGDIPQFLKTILQAIRT